MSVGFEKLTSSAIGAQVLLGTYLRYDQHLRQKWESQTDIAQLESHCQHQSTPTLSRPSQGPV